MVADLFPISRLPRLLGVAACTLSSMVVLKLNSLHGGAVAQLGARLDGIEEVVGSNPIGSTN